MSNRDLLAELSSVLVEAKDHSEGKLTLKAHQVNHVTELDISPDEIVHLRDKFNMSRGVFTRLLHTSSCTLDNWEQVCRAPSG
jgi:putative transcriptional regulator